MEPRLQAPAPPSPLPVSPSVRLVTLWSGPLPGYLPLFLGTAAHNRTVEFVFVADAAPPGPLPPNVRWVERSFADLVGAMGDRLGCDLSRAAPYKLCDVKPAFGVALGGVLDGCDFWGHVDCDAVLGDLRVFATDDRLAAHDVLSFKGRRFVHGPLTLWRNDEAVNRLYERAGWRRIFEADRYLGFDETGQRWGAARRPLPVAERQARGETECITDVVYTAAAGGEVRVYDGDHVVETKPRAEVPDLALLWDRGALTRATTGRPLALFHIHWAKSDVERGDPAYRLPPWGWDELPERFGITRGGIGPVGLGFRLAQAEVAGRAATRRLRAAGRRIRRAAAARLS